MSDTPRPERVTLTDDEREAVADAFSHATEVNCWRSTCDEALWTTVERIVAARESAVRAQIKADILAVENDPDRKRPLKDDAAFPTDLATDFEWAAQIAGGEQGVCPHERRRSFRSTPPHTECKDCGVLLTQKWVQA